MIQRFTLVFIFLIPSILFAQEDTRPNILLIVADDLGYSDLACFGGEISTPTIDKLASSGLKFTNFHTAPTCAPTRAMLFSGNDNHTAGMGSQMRKTGEWGYEGYLSDRIVPFPQLLKEAGYHTYIAGKWHLGTSSEHNAHKKGFEKSFTLLHGAGNHYNDQGLFEEDPISQYTENGEYVKWPEGKYSTTLYTEKIIEYIKENKDDNKPFFAMATYTSPHWPLQVDEEFWRKYEGKYSDGYEALRKKRLNGMKERNIIPQNTLLPELHSTVIPWDSLSNDQKLMEERKMELYAGMVDNLDFHVGVLFDYLESINEYENTLIIFISDNGAAANDFYYHPNLGKFIQQHFNHDYERMGLPDSFISYGPQWAEAGTSAFRYFKNYTTEGGLRAPMIISGPGIGKRLEPVREFVSVMDIAPTLLEVVNISYPKTYNNKTVQPIKGESMLSFLLGKAENLHDKDYVFQVEQAGYATITRHPWKLISMADLDTAAFKLYNTNLDLSEQNDLSEQFPAIRNELMDLWLDYRKKVKILDP